MAFTAQELANIANAAIDYHLREQPTSQTIQSRPLLQALMKKKKTFPGGAGNITIPVKGDYSTSFMGYNHDDQVSFRNPANTKRASFPWREVHDGIQITFTELKRNGISVVDSQDGHNTSNASDRELIGLHNLLEDKLEEMQESWERQLNLMFWKDGTQDPKVVPGLTAIISEAPTTGTVGGIDRSLNTWWRNRTNLAIASNSGTWANQPLVRALQQEFRQLRRYGGNPNLFLAGSDFMDAFEMELRNKGSYTLEGWAGKGSIDASVADLNFKGVNIVYDPTLDDLGKNKYGYVLDQSKIYPMVMDGEDQKAHTPARPADRFVLYRSITWTGGLVAKQLNCHGIYSIA